MIFYKCKNCKWYIPFQKDVKAILSKKTKDRNGINPNTKEQVVIKGRNVVKFKPTTTFKEEVKE